MTHESELENTSCDEFEPHDINHFCELDKLLINPGGHGHVFFSALQLFSCWQILQSLTEETEVANDGENKEVEVKQDEVFEIE